MRQEREWKVAVYIRLSREDGNDESLSVENQRKIIQSFLEESFQGAWVPAGEYVDDGVTGTGAERPGFQRMLRGIERGEVTCVVCKTLSRAFRNYADQGYFLESYFPRFGVRFISLGGPAVDSYLQPELLCGYEVPISGIMNDRYAGRTSIDVRRTLDMKRRRGEFIGAFAPYGYSKDPDDRSRLVVDEPAAQVVRKIFAWRVKGMSCPAIARKLNDRGVLAPSAYKRQSGLRYQNPKLEAGCGLWSPRTVSEILQNRVYAGTMVQGRQKVVSYKIHERRPVPPEEWFVVRDTHPALVDETLFERAAALTGRRGGGERAPAHSLSGLVYCAHCGFPMGRKSAKGHGYYACRRRRVSSCPGSSIREDKLETLLGMVLERYHLAPTELDEEEQEKQTDEQERYRRRQKLERLEGMEEELYIDWKSGTLSKEAYEGIRQRLHKKIKSLNEWLEKNKGEREKKPTEKKGEQFQLDRERVIKLVAGILVSRDKEVTIYLRVCSTEETSQE